MQTALSDADLAPAAVEVFATPRRLALLLRDTPPRQADQVIDKRGPALAAAFDDDGNPSRAALGFAGSCGVGVDQLERRETDKGAWLYFSSTQAGKSLAQLLPELLAAALGDLPIPKRMRWGERSDDFVRPVKWLLLMIDSEVVDAEIFGLRSANRTFGHRFHAPGALEIPAAADYESLLLSQGLVMASFEKRRDATWSNRKPRAWAAWRISRMPCSMKSPRWSSTRSRFAASSISSFCSCRPRCW
jgi:glycyl-tRNA synthetase beta chain